MKRIEFIAPVEAIRGNMSGKQTLVYAENDNRAFEAPEGVQYAKNYSPRFIGAKRAKDGLKYFSIKCKSATKIDTASLRRMAAMGATCSAYTADAGWTWPLSSRTKLEQNFLAAKAKDPSLTYRKYAFEPVYEMFRTKRSTVSIVGEHGTATAGNPFIKDAHNPLIVSDDVLQKFFKQLASPATSFSVEGVGNGIAWVGDSFVDIVDGNINVLGLSKDANDHVMYGDLYLKNPSNNYVSVDDTVIAEGVYTLTDETPE